MAVLVPGKIGEYLVGVCRGSASPSMGTTQRDFGHIVFLEIAIQRDLGRENLLCALVAECLIFWWLFTLFS